MGDATPADYYRDQRCRSDLTLRDVAERLGVSVSHWSDVEHGRRSVRRLDQIDAFLELFARPYDREWLVKRTVEVHGSVLVRDMGQLRMRSHG